MDFTGTLKTNKTSREERKAFMVGGLLATMLTPLRVGRHPSRRLCLRIMITKRASLTSPASPMPTTKMKLNI